MPAPNPRVACWWQQVWEMVLPPTCGAGGRPAAGDGQPKQSAGGHGIDHVLAGAGEDDGQRHLPVVRGVRREQCPPAAASPQSARYRRGRPCRARWSVGRVRPGSSRAVLLNASGVCPQRCWAETAAPRQGKQHENPAPARRSPFEAITTTSCANWLRRWAASRWCRLGHGPDEPITAVALTQASAHCTVLAIQRQGSSNTVLGEFVTALRQCVLRKAEHLAAL